MRVAAKPDVVAGPRLPLLCCSLCDEEMSCIAISHLLAVFSVFRNHLWCTQPARRTTKRGTSTSFCRSRQAEEVGVGTYPGRSSRVYLSDVLLNVEDYPRSRAVSITATRCVCVSVCGKMLKTLSNARGVHALTVRSFTWNLRLGGRYHVWHGGERKHGTDDGLARSFIQR